MLPLVQTRPAGITVPGDQRPTRTDQGSEEESSRDLPYLITVNLELRNDQCLLN